jgi:hypothetical protein
LVACIASSQAALDDDLDTGMPDDDDGGDDNDEDDDDDEQYCLRQS